MQFLREESYTQTIKIETTQQYVLYATIMATGIKEQSLAVTIIICSWIVNLRLKNDLNKPTKIRLGQKHLESSSGCNVVLKESILKQKSTLFLSNLELTPKTRSQKSQNCQKLFNKASKFRRSNKNLTQVEIKKMLIQMNTCSPCSNPDWMTTFNSFKSKFFNAVLKNEYFCPKKYKGAGTYPEEAMSFWSEPLTHEFYITDWVILGEKQRQKTTALVMSFQNAKSYRQKVHLKKIGFFCFKATVRTVGSSLRNLKFSQPIQLVIKLCGTIQRYLIEQGIPQTTTIYFDLIRANRKKCEFTLQEPKIISSNVELLISAVKLIYIPHDRQLKFKRQHQLDDVDQVLLHLSAKKCVIYQQLLKDWHSSGRQQTGSSCQFYTNLVAKIASCKRRSNQDRSIWGQYQTAGKAYLLCYCSKKFIFPTR